jgi:hypothetical protein
MVSPPFLLWGQIMKIRILVSCSSVTGSYTMGVEYDVDEPVAKDLIKAGYAEKAATTRAKKPAKSKAEKA